jgi:Zn-dependent metalloprotease
MTGTAADQGETMHDSLRCILPPPLLDKLARSDDAALRDAALDAIGLDARFRLARAEAASRQGGRVTQRVTFARIGGTPNRTIYDKKGGTTQTLENVVRAEGQPATDDVAATEAYDGLGLTYQYFWETYGRDSINGQGSSLHGVVHFGVNYPNAFWDGRAMFFGDGDGQMLTRTTAGVDVIGHELTHGLTQYEANLVYSGQSGALNESMSDVFGIQVKQKALGQDAATSDWLIGADIVGPALSPALRSMKEPGSANQHDQQPSDMDGYVDGGDVHVNSGIPNRAFHVAATTLGGKPWDAAGPIWYSALRDAQLTPTASFVDFARLTVIHAQSLYGHGSAQADAVRAGWDAVKVAL